MPSVSPQGTALPWDRALIPVLQSRVQNLGWRCSETDVPSPSPGTPVAFVAMKEPALQDSCLNPHAVIAQLAAGTADAEFKCAF